MTGHLPQEYAAMLGVSWRTEQRRGGRIGIRHGLDGRSLAFGGDAGCLCRLARVQWCPQCESSGIFHLRKGREGARGRYLPLVLRHVPNVGVPISFLTSSPARPSSCQVVARQPRPKSGALPPHSRSRGAEGHPGGHWPGVACNAAAPSTRVPLDPGTNELRRQPSVTPASWPGLLRAPSSPRHPCLLLLQGKKTQHGGT